MKVFLYSLALITSIISSSIAQPLRPHEVPSDVYLDRSGMPELVANSFVTASVVSPLLTINIFNDEARQLSGFFIGPLLGLSLPYLLNVDKPMYSGQSGTYNFFQRFGLANGLLLSFMTTDFGSSGDNAELFAGITSGLTLASTYAGLELYPSLRLTPAQASALTTGMWVGGASGLITLTLVDLDSISPRGVASLLFLTTNAGAASAFLLKDHFKIDRSRVVMMDISAVIGGLIGLGTGWLVKGENGPNEILSVTSLAGLFGGLFLAYDLTESLDSYKQKTQDQVTAFKLESPSFAMIPGRVKPSGRRDFAPGLNLLNGTW